MTASVGGKYIGAVALSHFIIEKILLAKQVCIGKLERCAVFSHTFCRGYLFFVAKSGMIKDVFMIKNIKYL